MKAKATINKKLSKICPAIVVFVDIGGSSLHKPRKSSYYSSTQYDYFSVSITDFYLLQ